MASSAAKDRWVILLVRPFGYHPGCPQSFCGLRRQAERADDLHKKFAALGLRYVDFSSLRLLTDLISFTGLP